MLLHEIELVTELVAGLRKKYKKEIGVLDIKILRHKLVDKPETPPLSMDSDYDNEKPLDSDDDPNKNLGKIVESSQEEEKVDEIEKIFNRPDLKFFTVQKNEHAPERDLRDVATQTGETYDEYMKLCTILAMDP